MSDYSDTESESSVSEAGWDAADFMQLAVELGRIDETSADPLELREALETLRNLDICAVERDEQLHATIQHVSNALMSFLDSIDSVQDQHLEEMRANLLELLNESCFTMLLEYRVLFRAIASDSVGESTTSIPVCWVDVILAKLGNAVVHAAGLFHGVRPSSQNLPDTVQAQKAEDMLRAAVQLPETWPQIRRVLGSEHASPAAIRLAFSLVWGMAVMADQLGDDSLIAPRPREDSLYDMLQLRVKQRGKMRAHGVGIHPLNIDENERVSYAMLVSLYASADPASLDVAGSPCRPQTYATLLETVQTILQSENIPPGSCHIDPAIDLDVARVILLKWGRTLPWSWRVWQDSRLHCSEIAECLTASWLYHLDTSVADISAGHSVEWWDDQLVDALESEPRSALSMMSRLLLAVLTSIDPAVVLRETIVIDVVLKACWGIKHVLPAILPDETALSSLYEMLYKLFLVMGNGESELATKDLITEVLSLSPDSVRLALSSLSDPRSECTLAWERQLSSHIKSLNNESCHDSISFPELRSMRQTLQLLTLVWRTDCTPCPAPEMMCRRFLSTLLGRLELEPLDSQAWSTLADATITAQAMSLGSATLQDLCLQDRFVWGLLQHVEPADLPLAASLATYIATTVQSRTIGGLAYAEAWDYFRDVLLLILNREFLGAEEPLALLVCPVICRVLVALVQHAPPNARCYILSSPWTGCMVMRMKNAEEETEQTDEYDEVLRELMRPHAKTLYRLLVNVHQSKYHPRSGSQTPNPTENFDDLKMTFCWNERRACIILG